MALRITPTYTDDRVVDAWKIPAASSPVCLTTKTRSRYWVPTIISEPSIRAKPSLKSGSAWANDSRHVMVTAGTCIFRLYHQEVRMLVAPTMRRL